MRTVRFLVDGRESTGTLEGEEIRSAAGRYPLAGVRLLAPARPTKIVCVGRNYRAHAAELDNDVPAEPLLFLKPPSALLAPGGSIVYPRESSRVDYEGELAVVIGARCRRVPRERAFSVVAGYTIFNDVTARDLQKSDGQWSRAKGFDTFAPVGPCIADGLDPASLRIKTYLNGALVQDAPTASMIFDVPTIIEYVSAAFTLEADDIIATGTPAGIGPMRPGDDIRVEIDGIGTLANAVVAEGAS